MYRNNHNYTPVFTAFYHKKMDMLSSVWIITTVSIIILVMLVFSPLYTENISYDCSVYENALDHLIRQIQNEKEMIDTEETVLNSRRQLEEIVNPCYNIVMEKLDEIVDTMDNIENNTLDVLQKTKKLIKTKVPLNCGLAQWKKTDEINIDGCTISINDPSECLFEKHGVSRIVYLGDSNAMRIAESSKTLMTSVDWTSVKTWNNCDVGKLILGDAFKSEFTKLNDNSGPLYFGKTNPGCFDCQVCVTSVSTGTYNNKKISHEYILMDYTKDTSLRTSTYETSQDAIIKGYLSKTPPDILFLSVGGFDMDYILTQKNTSGWSNNYENLIQNIKKHLPSTQICANVVPKIWKRHANSYQLDMVNVQRKILEKHNIKCVVDGYNLTSSIVGGRKARKYVKDGMHYPPLFYDTVNVITNSNFC